MRKKSVSNLFDTIFWYLLYFLPVLLYILSFVSRFITAIPALPAFFDSVGIVFKDNIIYTTLIGIFGDGGVFPLFGSDGPFLIFTWFVSVFLIHLAVDFLLFIPRLAHKYMDKFCQND